ncbi:MAG: preprotein translocase subunit SecE [Saprospiraceae bacterium]|nr:preprotein translocase subunit SecE [Saprospiraceae bacterium]
MDKLRLYVSESLEEFKTKMTWPTWTNLQQTTGIVLVASAIIALIIFGMDSVCNFGLKLIYGVK